MTKKKKATGITDAVQAPKPASTFDEMVDAVLGALRAELLATHGRQTRGAFAYGRPGLHAVAAELLQQNPTPQNGVNAAAYVLAGVLLSLGAYGLKRAETPAADAR